MSTSVSLKPVAARNRCPQSLQLASAIQSRRVQILKMTIERAAEFSGLKPDLWCELEAGFIPPLDNTLWIWWTLAGTLEWSVSKLFNLASVDLARNEMLARKERAA
jgi:hypothetical protein